MKSRSLFQGGCVLPKIRQFHLSTADAFGRRRLQRLGRRQAQAVALTALAPAERRRGEGQEQGAGGTADLGGDIPRR